MSAKHTPEPWNLHPHYKCEPLAVEDESGNAWIHWSAVIAKGDMVIAETKGSTSRIGFPNVENGREVQANADRIIACVNACKGINPDAVPELLEALKKLCDTPHDCEGGYSIEETEAWIQARAAITKAEGGPND